MLQSSPIPTSYIPKSIQEHHGTRVLKAEFCTIGGINEQIQFLPKSFLKLKIGPKYIKVFDKLRLKEYFGLPLCHLDIKRCYNAMTLIDRNRTLWLVNLDNEWVYLTIIKDILREALHLKKDTLLVINKVSKAKKKEVFYMKPR